MLLRTLSQQGHAGLSWHLMHFKWHKSPYMIVRFVIPDATMSCLTAHSDLLNLQYTATYLVDDSYHSHGGASQAEGRWR